MPLRSRKGFTLIEIVITLAIIMILTSVGIGMSDGIIPRYRTRMAANTFASKVQECRLLAVRANRECSVWLVSADSDLTDVSSNTGEYWVGLGDADRDSSTWDYLPVDADLDGSDDDTSQGIIDIGDSDGDFFARRVAIENWGANLSGPGTGNSDRIVFSPRGYLINPSNNFDTNGHITVNFVNKKARSESLVEDYTVYIARSGMVRVDKSKAPEFNTLVSGTVQHSSE